MKRALSVAAVLFASAAAPAAADVVTDWNEVLLDAVRTDRTTPPAAARAMAMVHTAMFDAVNGIVGGYEPFMQDWPAPPGASPEAAAAAAAHHVLSELFPAQRDTFDAALEASVDGIPMGRRLRGMAFGRRCGTSMAFARAADGWDAEVPYEPTDIPGLWTPTPPAYAPALLPQWPLVTPFCMESGSQFRVPEPPDLAGAAYAADFNEVKALGGVASQDRTPEQTEIALFWADGPGTATPPGHWLMIAQEISEAEGLTLVENARLFALLSLAEADAGICSWDNKFAFEAWRPVTAIQRADEDGNPATEPDPDWMPLLTTPPFPTYTSGHSTFSGAGSRILALYFGADDHPFTTTSDAMPGVERSFASFSEAAEEAGRSRIYGGIHFEYDNVHGLASGRALAESLFEHFLRPADRPPELSPGHLPRYLSAFANGDPAADFNGDGTVDVRDAAILIAP